MKLGEICSPISSGGSIRSGIVEDQTNSWSRNLRRESDRRERIEKQVETGLTGEFVAIKLDSPLMSSHRRDENILSPLTAVSADEDDEEEDEVEEEDEDEDVENEKQEETSNRLLDIKPIETNHHHQLLRRRFEMHKCSSAHNILKAPVAFVNRSNARISLSPIQSSLKRDVSESLLTSRQTNRNIIRDYNCLYY